MVKFHSFYGIWVVSLVCVCVCVSQLYQFICLQTLRLLPSQLQEILLWTLRYMCLFEWVFSFSLDIYPGMELLVKIWGEWQSQRRHGRSRPPPSPIPCPIHHFHLAGSWIYSFIINRYNLGSKILLLSSVSCSKKLIKHEQIIRNSNL